MKLVNFRVSNFRSLQDFEMTDIGNLNILIGRNGSGKSNVLEAIELFLSEITPALEDQDSSVPNYIWSRQNPEEPIIFVGDIHLSKEELSLPGELNDAFSNLDDANYRITISRALLKTPKKMWKLITLTVNSYVLCIDGSLTEDVLNPESDDRKLALAILARLRSLIQQSFRLIGFDRIGESSGKSPGQRTAAIPQTTIQGIVEIENSTNPEQDAISYELKNMFNAMNPAQELLVSSSTIMVREGSTRIPLQLLGVGTQTIIGLIHELLRGGEILCIEEPELHLHAGLQRSVFAKILQLGENSQIFVTTHSTTFLDECQYGHIWHITKINGATTAAKAHDLASLQDVCIEMGTRPSDVLMANSILFVEGFTEKIIFPAWAKLMNKNLHPPRISIVPMRGAGKGRYHLGVWNEAAITTGVPRFIVLDGDSIAKREAKKLLDSGLIKPDKMHNLGRRSIEDYYPKRLVLEKINQLYNLSENQKESLTSFLEEGSVQESIVNALRKFLFEFKLDTSANWKIELAQYVAQNSTIRDIGPEIQDLIRKISDNLNPVEPIRAYVGQPEEPIRSSQTTPQLIDSLRDFYQEKNPRTQKEEVLLFYYWLTKTRRGDWFPYNEIEACYDEVAVKKPARIRDAVKRLVADGNLLRGKEAGIYRISMHGEQYVERNMPST